MGRRGWEETGSCAASPVANLERKRVSKQSLALGLSFRSGNRACTGGLGNRECTARALHSASAHRGAPPGSWRSAAASLEFVASWERKG